MNNMDFSIRMYHTEKFRFEFDTEVGKTVYRDLHQFAQDTWRDYEEMMQHCLFLGTPEIPYRRMSML